MELVTDFMSSNIDILELAKFSYDDCLSNSFILLFQEGDENDVLPYWLSNTSALLCLLQRNLRSNGFMSAGSQRSAGSAGPNGRPVQVSLVVGLSF